MKDKMTTRSAFALVLASLLASASLPAAVPLSWTVETTRATPATFEAYQGETLTFEAALQSRGKPLEAPLNYSFFWQTNGMGSTYWEKKVVVGSRSRTEEDSNSYVELGLPTTTNVLFATWSPDMDVGAKVYNCFIGSPSNIYHAAFQLRLRPSPGASPNALPLPVPVIDFARVRVLNPPWGGGGVDTNAVRDIIHATVDGAARPLPKYLHERNFDDSYPAEAEEYYRSRGDGKTDGGCSAVRSGGYLYRNFDYPFDDRAEFVVRMSAGTVPSASSPTGADKHRFASIGVAQVGTNLTEQVVTSGKPNRWYKALPGATVDGINEHGVVAEINVVDTPVTGWHTNATDKAIHPLAAVRWVLDNATNAQSAAEYIAANIRFPAGWTQNFHYMIADATSTYIVENGTATNGDEYHEPDEPVTMTNFQLSKFPWDGMGMERFGLLLGGANITNAWYTNAYSPTANWRSEFKSIDEQNTATNGWARLGTMAARRATGLFWQSVHTSVYDISNRTLRVAVQETDDWYVFQVPVTSPKIDAYTKAETDERVADAVYDRVRYENIAEEWVEGESYTNGQPVFVRVCITDAKNFFVCIKDHTGDDDVKFYDTEYWCPIQDYRFASQDDLAANVSSLSSSIDDVSLAAAAAQQTADAAQQTASSASASVTQLAGQVGTIGAHLNAEDARFVSTNYNSATHMPEAYVEIKLPDNSWSVIWREMTRWNWLLDDYLPQHHYTKSQVDAALEQKADRAWGYYDSHSGTYAPDGYTWISSPKVALAAGLGYQRTVTTEGAIWVLESNGLVTETGGVASNGFFRISDDEGNVHFEIIKGNKRTIGADASSCKVVGAFTPTKLQIGYSIVSDAHPTLRICNDLKTLQWKDETDPECLANVTWEGQSGAWVAFVQGKAAQSLLFVTATYETGAESYIRNVAPVSMEYMYLGGQKYSVGTATISGHTVLTLTPAN